MFSRFDNMMQHTHTHNRTKRKEHSDDKKSPSSRSSSASIGSTPNTPNTEQSMYIDHHRILPRSEVDYYSYKDYQQHTSYYQQQPPPPPPPQQQQWGPVYYPMMIQSPTIYNTMPPQHQQQQAPIVSPVTDEFNNEETQDKQKKIELSTPIQELANDESYSIIDIHITPDELEALQGFGKFCTKPIIREPIVMTRITTSPSSSISLTPSTHCSAQALLSNHVLNSKLQAFRQHVSPIHESSIRNY